MQPGVPTLVATWLLVYLSFFASSSPSPPSLPTDVLTIQTLHHKVPDDDAEVPSAVASL